MHRFECTYTVPAAVVVHGYRRTTTGKGQLSGTFMVVRGPAGIGTDSKHKFHIEVRLGEKQGRKVKSVWGKGLWR